LLFLVAINSKHIRGKCGVDAFGRQHLFGDATCVLQNVSGAIQKGGTDYAVEFCNIQAMPLTDSIANNRKVYIQRLSDKNRNPDNGIQTEIDSMAWERMKLEKTNFTEQDKNGEVYYYKPIFIAMPTCLKCHGGDNDITESTKKLLPKNIRATKLSVIK
jgi:hypothetical protein